MRILCVEFGDCLLMIKRSKFDVVGKKKPCVMRVSEAWRRERTEMVQEEVGRLMGMKSTYMKMVDG